MMSMAWWGCRFTVNFPNLEKKMELLPLEWQLSKTKREIFLQTPRNRVRKTWLFFWAPWCTVQVYFWFDGQHQPWQTSYHDCSGRRDWAWQAPQLFKIQYKQMRDAKGKAEMYQKGQGNEETSARCCQNFVPDSRSGHLHEMACYLGISAIHSPCCLYTCARKGILGGDSELSEAGHSSFVLFHQKLRGHQWSTWIWYVLLQYLCHHVNRETCSEMPWRRSDVTRSLVCLPKVPIFAIASSIMYILKCICIYIFIYILYI